MPCHAEQSEHMISINITWSEKIDCLPNDEDWMTWRHLFPPVFMETKKRRGEMQQCWKIVIIIRVSRLVHSLSWLKAKHREANTQEWTPLHVPVDMYQCWIQRHIRIHDACVYADGYYFYISSYYHYNYNSLIYHNISIHDGKMMTECDDPHIFLVSVLPTGASWCKLFSFVIEGIVPGWWV